MAVFPRIDSPCPYKGGLAAVMDGDTCRLCKRQVFDLSPMTDAERTAFLKGCSGEVCVTYRLRAGPALAAAVALAALAAPVAAAAEDHATEITELVVTGGIKDPGAVRLVEDAADGAIPDLPVVYEAADAAAPDAALPAAAAPAS